MVLRTWAAPHLKSPLSLQGLWLRRCHCLLQLSQLFIGIFRYEQVGLGKIFFLFYIRIISHFCPAFFKLLYLLVLNCWWRSLICTLVLPLFCKQHISCMILPLRIQYIRGRQPLLSQGKHCNAIMLLCKYIMWEKSQGYGLQVIIVSNV